MKKYKDLSIEYWDVEKLIPYARNPRKNDEAAQKLAGVIAEFGFQVPIIIRGSGEVIDGHARLKAASILGMKKVPVIVNDEWTETQAKAFRLSVNKSAEWAEWDDELLGLELQDLKLENFDLNLIDFDISKYVDLSAEYEPEVVTDEEEKDEDISSFEGHEEDYLLKKRVILVYTDDEEAYLKEHILKIGSDEKVIVVYNVEDIMKREERNGITE